MQGTSEGGLLPGLVCSLLWQVVKRNAITSSSGELSGVGRCNPSQQSKIQEQVPSFDSVITTIKRVASSIGLTVIRDALGKKTISYEAFDTHSIAATSTPLPLACSKLIFGEVIWLDLGICELDWVPCISINLDRLKLSAHQIC